jgi:hypothetical protein
VKHDAVVIMQAQNTSLTDGAAPDAGYDRPVVVTNTLKLDGIQLLEDGKQVVSRPGPIPGSRNRSGQPAQWKTLPDYCVAVANTDD